MLQTTEIFVVRSAQGIETQRSGSDARKIAEADVRLLKEIVHRHAWIEEHERLQHD